MDSDDDTFYVPDKPKTISESDSYSNFDDSSESKSYSDPESNDDFFTEQWLHITKFKCLTTTNNGQMKKNTLYQIDNWLSNTDTNLETTQTPNTKRRHTIRLKHSPFTPDTEKREKSNIRSI